MNHVNTAPPSAPKAPPWAHIADAKIITADAAAETLSQLELWHTQYVPTQRPVAAILAHAAAELGRSDLRRRADLVSADAAIRQGEIVAGSTLAREVKEDAERESDMFALARAHYLMAWTSQAIGDSPDAQINGIRSLELLPDDTAAEIVMDHLTIAAIAHNPSPQADAYFDEALRIAARCSDPARTITIHNNIAYAALQRGDLDKARDHVTRMHEAAATAGAALPISQLETAAALYNAEGRYRAAIDVLSAVTEMDNALAPTAAPPDSRLAVGLLALARSRRGLREFDAAQQHLDQARRRATGSDRHHLDARITQEQALLHADRGDYAKAFAQYVAFHEAVVSLQSDEQQARSRIVQATFDAERNRKQVEHFRQLAMRDALTGLYNRRFMDEMLSDAIRIAERDNQTLSLAIIDTDFFKRINDQLSHEVGDAVLRELASVLLDAKTTDSTVCRLGGEEFVVVMPNVANEAAVALCGGIRRAVADHDWSPLIGELPLTVSIGVTTLRRGRASVSVLLAEADHNLYAAKRSGRNRVMTDAHV